MELFVCLLAALCAYVVSGINPAIVLSGAIYHTDIRTQGSGNPGFTNFRRVYGPKYAWFVFVLDIGKSALLCAIFGALFRAAGMSRQLGAAYTGFFAMLGHAYPIWYKFRGGKGFLVGAAAIFVMDGRVGLIAFAVLALLLFTTKYMSLSVIAAAVSCPILLAVFGVETPWVLVFCCLSAAFMIGRHKGNIQRLRAGTEPKFTFIK